MRSHQNKDTRASDLRRAIGRLDGLPLRPMSARLVLDASEDEDDRSSDVEFAPTKGEGELAFDPGWALARARSGDESSALELVAGRPWWPNPQGSSGEALRRLWRHAVAVSLEVGRLAREAEDPQRKRLARAGLLHGLGLWALAAIDPQRLAAWLAEADPGKRLDLEREWLGTEASTLGRQLAERWGSDPLVVDAAWLHADPESGLGACASDPDRLALVQRAFALAEQTPWALHRAEPRDPGTMEPGLRVLVAEVQVRCGPGLVAADATPREERLARSNARLRIRLVQLQREQAAGDRLLDALAESDVGEGPEAWAERAGKVWCGEPGIVAARVVWAVEAGRAVDAEDEHAEKPARQDPSQRPPWRIIPLSKGGRPDLEVHLWKDLDGAEPSLDLASPPALGAWRAWAAHVAGYYRMQARLDSALRAHRDRLEHEETRLGKLKLNALAEFAAGAGHELNNPLAVIVGRAQLLLAREVDPQASRSLRAIMGQAKRAHRILRDLMYVARPPELRPRSCQPDEVVRACMRDLIPEAEARGVRLVDGPNDAWTSARTWTDPDALRHLVETLLRNSLEATPRGGTVRVSVGSDDGVIRGSIQDTGRGIGPLERSHLFDPFFCGRQAGRGLGLGLPRIARMLALSHGELRWQSAPGQGTHIQFTLPQTSPPPPPPLDPGGRSLGPRGSVASECAPPNN